MLHQSTYNKQLKTKARKLRRKQTDAESLLWYKLRNKQLLGYKFRRQHPIGKYIVDFYCSKNNLAIEVDGGHHAICKQNIYDKKRTANLIRRGVKLIRFWDSDVLQNTDGVLEIIIRNLEHSEDLTLKPSPTRRG